MDIPAHLWVSRHGVYYFRQTSRASDLLNHLEALDQKNLADAEEAIKDLDYSANIYPTSVDVHAGQVVQADFQQPFDNRYLFERLKRNSVSAFLAKQKKQQSCTQPTEDSARAEGYLG